MVIFRPCPSTGHIQMEKKGLKLPTLDFIRRKAKKLDEVKNTSLKEEDVDKV